MDDMDKDKDGYVTEQEYVGKPSSSSFSLCVTKCPQRTFGLSMRERQEDKSLSGWKVRDNTSSMTGVCVCATDTLSPSLVPHLPLQRQGRRWSSEHAGATSVDNAREL